MSVPNGSGDEGDDEAWVIATESGRKLLEAVSEVKTPGPAELARWRKLASPERVAAALRIASTRQRGAAKFSRAAEMWLDAVGLEQATAEAVARHKAQQFQVPLVVDLCSGIGGDALAIAAHSHVLAVDANQTMCRRLVWNAGVYGVAGRVLACRGRAQQMALPPNAWIHIDPDRRSKNDVRARGVGDYEPGLPFLFSLVREAAGGAVKLGPASDFTAHFSDPRFEVELISLQGECKEATIWFGEAATCHRRATRLPEGTTWTDRDGQGGLHAVAGVGPLGAFIYDPDPALIRAGLLDGFAIAHELHRVAPGVDYLTSSRLVSSPFLSAFEVASVHPLDVKRLRRLVADENLGPLEIKVRGLKITPEALRAELRPRGDRPGTLLLVGGLDATRVIRANRLKPGGGDVAEAVVSPT